MMPTITLPDTKKGRRRVYCIMLDLKQNCKLSNEELVLLCIQRGYIEKQKEASSE